MNKNTLSSYLSRPRLLVVAALAVALLAIVIVLRSPQSPNNKPPVAAPAQVVTALVKTEDVPIVQSGPGNVLSPVSVTIKARVDGQLESVEFKEGQDVKAGQLLARIDSRLYQAQLDQAVAQKAKDEATLANAEVDLQRYEGLIKEQATTQQVLDTQRAVVKQLRAAVLADQAQINYAQVQRGYTQISAPVSGRIGARLVDPGNIVRAADNGGLLIINQIDPIALQFTLPETVFQALNKALQDSRKPLKVQALERETQSVLAEGELTLVNNQIDTSNGTFVLKARFANASHRLWPGQSLNARIFLGEHSNALTIPASALQSGQSGFFVYVVEQDDIVRIQNIGIAQKDDRLVVVNKGLAAGDRVVIDGQYRLSPGARVTEVAPGGAAAGAKP